MKVTKQNARFRCRWACGHHKKTKTVGDFQEHPVQVTVCVEKAWKIFWTELKMILYQNVTECEKNDPWLKHTDFDTCCHGHVSLVFVNNLAPKNSGRIISEVYRSSDSTT